MQPAERRALRPERSEENFMARAKAPESQKKTGDVMESLIERSDAETDERRNAPSNDDDTLERDPDDEDPEDDDEDLDDSDSDDE